MRLSHRIRQPHAAAFSCHCVRQTRGQTRTGTEIPSYVIIFIAEFPRTAEIIIIMTSQGSFPAASACGKRMRQPQKSNIAGSSNAGVFDAHVCRTHGKNSVHLIWIEGYGNRMRQPDTWNGSLVNDVIS